MIGKLKYVVYSRPNITQVVGIVARFSSNPKETCLTIVKRIFKYLKGIKDYGLWYKQEGNFELRLYIDIDQVDNVHDRKSTSGGDLFLGEILITWLSKKQSYISQSIAKVEYVVISINCLNIV